MRGRMLVLMMKMVNEQRRRLAGTFDLFEARQRTRLVITAAAILLWMPALAVLRAEFGLGAASIALLPAVIGGWSLGIRGGLATALALVAANAVVAMAAGTYERAGLPGVASLFIAAALAGGVRNVQLSARTRMRTAEARRQETEGVTSELRRSYASLDQVLESAPLQMAQIDDRGIITAFRGTALIGVPIDPTQLVGRSLLDLRADHPQIPHLLRRALLGESIAETVAIGDRWEHIRMTPVHGPDGRVHGLNTVSLDVTARELALESARQLESTDPLTGLANRAALLAQGERVMERDNGSVGVLALDLEGFRELNAAYGHAACDEILKVVARRLTATISSRDTVARFTGNSYVVLLRAPGDQVGAIVRRIQATFEHPIEIDGDAIEVTASIGSACGPEDASTFDTLVHDAELAMQEAKRTRAGHVPFMSELIVTNRDRVTLLADLRRAIDDDELDIEYQPIVSLEDRRTVGVEALLRWDHRTRGPLSPATFIPFVERSSLGRRLSRWVVRRMWHDTRTFAAIAGPLSFAVNLSARDLASTEVMDEVKALRRRVGKGGRVVAEITESDLMADPERAIAALTALRVTGVQIAIDDFGTGYSSLAYLHRLPVDELKIDRSFVARMGDDRRAREVVRATITIAHALGLKVVAEGCEDERALEMLTALGCDRAQGWGIARAMTVERLAAWLFEQARAPLRVPPAVIERHPGGDPVTAAAD